MLIRNIGNIGYGSIVCKRGVTDGVAGDTVAKDIVDSNGETSAIPSVGQVSKDPLCCVVQELTRRHVHLRAIVDIDSTSNAEVPTAERGQRRDYSKLESRFNTLSKFANYTA